jgi:hypothetical protein
MDLPADCIEQILTFDVDTKFCMSQLNKYWYSIADRYMLDTDTAIIKLDYFTLIRSRNYDWCTRVGIQKICELGDPVLVIKYLENSPLIHHRQGLYGAARSGNPKIMKIMIAAQNYCSDTCRTYLCGDIWNHGLAGAIASKNPAAIQMMLDMNIDYDWNRALYAAFKAGNMDLAIDFANRGGVISSVDALMAICAGGHEDMLEHIPPTTITIGIINAACEGGNLNIAKKVLGDESLNWNEVLLYACMSGNLALIDYIIERGVQVFDHGLAGAYAKGHIDIVDYMIKLGAIHTINSGIMAFLSADARTIDKFIHNVRHHTSTEDAIIAMSYGAFGSHDFNGIRRLLSIYKFDDCVECGLHAACTASNTEFIKFIYEPEPILKILGHIHTIDTKTIQCRKCNRPIADHI